MLGLSVDFRRRENARTELYFIHVKQLVCAPIYSYYKNTNGETIMPFGFLSLHFLASD